MYFKAKNCTLFNIEKIFLDGQNVSLALAPVPLLTSSPAQPIYLNPFHWHCIHLPFLALLCMRFVLFLWNSNLKSYKIVPNIICLVNKNIAYTHREGRVLEKSKIIIFIVIIIEFVYFSCCFNLHFHFVNVFVCVWKVIEKCINESEVIQWMTQNS